MAQRPVGGKVRWIARGFKGGAIQQNVAQRAVGGKVRWIARGLKGGAIQRDVA